MFQNRPRTKLDVQPITKLKVIAFKCDLETRKIEHIKRFLKQTLSPG
jgi:hypothetical protein